MIVNPKTTRELLPLINTFSDVAGYKINLKKSVALLYTNDNEAEREIRGISSFTIATNDIKKTWNNSHQTSGIHI